jgi:hypothetical protein
VAITQVGTTQTFAFADGNAGHSCAFGSAPSAGHWDVLFVNSNTTVSTPSGWTRSDFRVANQGAYAFTRKALGGEGSAVTLTTTGDHNTEATWTRWAGADQIDIAVHANADAAAGSTTPALTTAALATSGEVMLAFGAVHGAVPTTPVWSSGYTPLAATTQGTGATAATGYVAVKNPAGTAAESPNVSWTGPCPNRYIFALSLTPLTASLVSDSDVGSGADAGTVTATTSAADTGQAAEASSLVVHVSDSDTVTGLDTAAAPSAVLSAGDTGSAAEAASTTAMTSAADTGQAVESTTLAAALAATDTGTGSESATVTATVTAADTVHAAEAEAVTIPPPAPPARGRPIVRARSGSEVTLR